MCLTLYCRIDETREASLYTGFCPEDLEAETEFTYCTCNTNSLSVCSEQTILQDCSPALKTKRGKKRGKVLKAKRGKKRGKVLKAKRGKKRGKVLKAKRGKKRGKILKTKRGKKRGKVLKAKWGKKRRGIMF
jgi:hypothetical protein